jgi:DNA-binding protein H-NS
MIEEEVTVSEEIYNIEPTDVHDVMDSLLGDRTVAELLIAKDRVEELLTARIDKEYDLMRQSVESIAKATGMSVQQVYAILRPKSEKRTGTKVAADEPAKPERVKYRHPDYPAMTWSGRGREPRWIGEALEAGYTQEELLAQE